MSGTPIIPGNEDGGRDDNGAVATVCNRSVGYGTVYVSQPAS